MNKIEFTVNNIALFRKLSLHYSAITLIAWFFVMGSKLFFGGNGLSIDNFDVAVFITTSIELVILALLIAFLSSLYAKRAFVELVDENICGINVWGRRICIPLEKIKETRRFSGGGVNFILVESKQFFVIYIPENTNNIDELLTIINANIETNT